MLDPRGIREKKYVVRSPGKPAACAPSKMPVRDRDGSQGPMPSFLIQAKPLKLACGESRKRTLPNSLASKTVPGC